MTKLWEIARNPIKLREIGGKPVIKQKPSPISAC
jgi:hypothetical protein